MVRLGAGVVLFALVTLGSACAIYRDELARGQRAFERNEHDRTLAILRELEPDLKRLSAPEQASYAYLRGMSDYRVGYKADARHWLALAKAYEGRSPGVLPSDWKARTNATLEELNAVVYAGGAESLPTSRESGDATRSSVPQSGVQSDGGDHPRDVPAEPSSK